MENLYRPLWSSAILDELHYHQIEKPTKDRGFDRAEALRRAARLIEQMRSNFDDAEVQNWEPYEGTFGLPDPDDEHVVAAAVAGRGIPVDIVESEVIALIRRSPDVELTQRRRNPPVSVDDFLATLRDAYGTYEAVDLIQDVQ